MPPLRHWLPHYALPSILSIATTYVVLRLTQRPALRQATADDVQVPPLSVCGRIAAGGVALAAVAPMIASARDWQLGLPTCVAGLVSAAAVLLVKRSPPLRTCPPA